MSAPLNRLAADHAILRERLQLAYGLDERDETLTDTLEGISDFKEMAVAALREAKQREAMADAMDAIIAENRVRKERHATAAARIRAAVADAMMEAGELKLTAPDLSASLRYGKQKVEIAGEVDADYLIPKTTFSPDKEKIAAELAEGKTLSFAYLTNAAPVLTVRTR